MIFTSALLNTLERNTGLKKAYATPGSLGQNRFVAIPVIVGFIAAFGAYSFYDMSKTDSAYTMYIIICAVLIVICVAAVVIIQANAKKKVLGSLDDVKICIAKKILGNEKTGVYYSIYTPGDKRHDTNFIESVADKIINIAGEPDGKIKNEINSLFSVNFEGMNATPVLLPMAFTYGEEVYKQEFKFSTLDDQMKLYVQENNDQFIVLSFHNRSVLALKSMP